MEQNMNSCILIQLSRKMVLAPCRNWTPISPRSCTAVRCPYTAAMATSPAQRPVRGPHRIAVPAQAQPNTSALKVILPAVILFYSVLLPSEIRISLAEQNLYPTRLAAFVILPWIFHRLMQRQTAWTLWDALFLFGVFWMVLAFMVFYGPGVGLRRGGILAFDVVIPFLTGRLCFRDSNDFRRFLIFVAPGLFLAGATLLMEVMAARPLIRPAAASVFGNLSAYEGGNAVGLREVFIDRRLGILRATGPFPHPILAGILLAGFLPLYFMSGIRKWPLFIGLGASFFAVFSASSAAFLALIIGILLMTIDWLQRILEFISWRIILPIFGLMLLVLHFMTDRGVIVFFSSFTLNPQTSAFRRIIWEYGTRSVEKHPWFGIGFSEYERPVWMLTASVDNHWLLLAMRHGLIPALSTLAVAIAGVVLLSASSARVPEDERRLRVGLAIALFSIILLGFSVAFFGGAIYWFYMMFAIALSLAKAPVARQGAKVRVAVPMHMLERGPQPQRIVKRP